MGTLRAILKVLSFLAAVLLTSVLAMLFYKVRTVYTDEPITTGVIIAAYGYAGGSSLILLTVAWRWLDKNLGRK